MTAGFKRRVPFQVSRSPGHPEPRPSSGPRPPGELPYAAELPAELPVLPVDVLELLELLDDDEPLEPDDDEVEVDDLEADAGLLVDDEPRLSFR